MTRFDDEARRRLATGWDPRVCTAKEYAMQNAVSERVLRMWRARFRREQVEFVLGGNADVPNRAALDALQVRLAELAAAVAAVQAALHPAAACGQVPAGDNGGDDPDPPPTSPPAAGACRPADQTLEITERDLEQVRAPIQTAQAPFGLRKKKPGSFFSHFD